MIKEGSENESALLILLIFYKTKKNHKNLTLLWIIRFKKYLAPLEILMSKISLKYIPIHIHNFKHSKIMNMKLSSHGFLFHRNINRREKKVKIYSIIYHNGKDQRIYIYIYMIIELHKLKWL